MTHFHAAAFIDLLARLCGGKTLTFETLIIIFFVPPEQVGWPRFVWSKMRGDGGGEEALEAGGGAGTRSERDLVSGGFCAAAMEAFISSGWLWLFEQVGPPPTPEGC